MYYTVLIIEELISGFISLLLLFLLLSSLFDSFLVPLFLINFSFKVLILVAKFPLEPRINLDFFKYVEIKI